MNIIDYMIIEYIIDYIKIEYYIEYCIYRRNR